MFSKLIEKRRSIYSLGKKEALSQNEIIDLIEHSIKHAPSAFNSQSPRAVILLGKQHERIWNIVLETLKKIVPEQAFPKTKTKIEASFKSGYGTVLFFEDDDTTKKLQNDFKAYADNFPRWAEQASAIAQYAVWLALAEKNIGASLQHYSPIIDDAVKAEWNIPSNWHLISQMPFGSIEAPAGDKEFMTISDRVKVYK